MIAYLRSITLLLMLAVLQGTCALHAMQQNRSATALYGAIKSNDVQEVQRIINNGFDVNSNIPPVNLYTRTPLYWAVQEYNKYINNTLEIIKILLDAGARINSDHMGRDPLYLAIKTSKNDVIDCLLSYGANTQLVLEFLKENRKQLETAINREITLQELAQTVSIDAALCSLKKYQEKEDKIKKLQSTIMATVESLLGLESADMILNVLKYLEFDSLPEPMKKNIVEKLKKILHPSNIAIKNTMINNLFSNSYWDSTGKLIVDTDPQPNAATPAEQFIKKVEAFYAKIRNTTAMNKSDKDHYTAYLDFYIKTLKEELLFAKNQKRTLKINCESYKKLENTYKEGVKKLAEAEKAAANNPYQNTHAENENFPQLKNELQALNLGFHNPCWNPLWQFGLDYSLNYWRVESNFRTFGYNLAELVKNDHDIQRINTVLLKYKRKIIRYKYLDSSLSFLLRYSEDNQFTYEPFQQETSTTQITTADGDTTNQDKNGLLSRLKNIINPKRQLPTKSTSPAVSNNLPAISNLQEQRVPEPIVTNNHTHDTQTITSETQVVQSPVVNNNLQEPSIPVSTTTNNQTEDTMQQNTEPKKQEPQIVSETKVEQNDDSATINNADIKVEEPKTENQQTTITDTQNNTPEKPAASSTSLSLMSKFGIGSVIIAGVTGLSIMAYKFINYVHLRSIKAQQTILATLLEKAKAHDAQALQRAYQQAHKKLPRITAHDHAQIKMHIKAQDYTSLIALLDAKQKQLSALCALSLLARIKA